METPQTPFSIDQGAQLVPDANASERFHMVPSDRLKAVAAVGGLVGGFAGVYEGVKLSSLRYLTENGHRLPRTVGGWYFYHKKKNYVMIINGCREGLKQGTKYSLAVAGFFGLEHLLDHYVRNDTIDFASTTVSGMAVAALFASYNRLSRVQTVNYIQKGAGLGLSLGVAQDMMIWARGGRVWYLEKLGVANTRFERKMAA